jgi:4,5-DOPA dioxygenase extradiol
MVRGVDEEARMPDALMPVVFVGHGSPMNAIEDNEFSRGWSAAAAEWPRPAAILCVSAHWETRGTAVMALPQPETIHDFYGFPRELFEVQYPAPGEPRLANEVCELLAKASATLDTQWGLDHGCWSVLKHMYPRADVPTVQLSLDRTRSAREHYELARELRALRAKGVLVVGSGNMVHNLRRLNWEDLETPYDWAEEANAEFKRRIASGDDAGLTDYAALGRSVALAIPTPEHYLPMLYVLGLRGAEDRLHFFNDRVLSSLSMTSFVLRPER